MVVRGAPAIAVAGALSLAVEVSNMETFNGTSEDAASYLANALEYLVSSRPTAVNLSDAAIKLKEVISKAASTSSEASVVFQGSRLTAFELVHDNIPATLITDSAAAALMKAGRINAIIVGADRVAANGDTANKIGTYSLAVLAIHHRIPFYVAAPLTSIDLALSSGQEIVIEERSAKELLHSRGGLGEQVAASGISVWNPAFDVTPAHMISGIITEKGVVTKKGSDTFDIKGFVQKAIDNS
ncbi:hypothetical protein C3L33_19238, partial [Rhododendron williamsianum]